jgi:hypothetical protein
MGRPLQRRSRQSGLSWSNAGWGCPMGCAVRGRLTRRGAAWRGAHIHASVGSPRMGMAGQLRHRLPARLPALMTVPSGIRLPVGAKRGDRIGSFVQPLSPVAGGPTMRRAGRPARRAADSGARRASTPRGIHTAVNRRACCCWASISDMSFSSSFSICTVERARHACNEPCATCKAQNMRCEKLPRAKHATCKTATRKTCNRR